MVLSGGKLNHVTDKTYIYFNLLSPLACPSHQLVEICILHNEFGNVCNISQSLHSDMYCLSLSLNERWYYPGVNCIMLRTKRIHVYSLTYHLQLVLPISQLTSAFSIMNQIMSVTFHNHFVLICTVCSVVYERWKLIVPCYRQILYYTKFFILSSSVSGLSKQTWIVFLIWHLIIGIMYYIISVT